jgi:tubulin-specific chaperone C
MLDQLRTKAASKPKFAFKRKAVQQQQQPPLASAATSADPIIGPSAPISGTKAAAPPAPPSQSTPSASTLTSTLPNAVTLKDRRDVRLLPSSIPSPVPAAAPTRNNDNVIPPQTLTLANLEGVFLDLRDSGDDLPYALSALHADGIKRSILLLPRLSGSAMLHNLHDCVIVLGCHQVRWFFHYIHARFLP